jgi:hypothetical protein
MKKINQLIVAASFLIVTGCEKILEPDVADTGRVTLETFYVNYNGALQGINGVHASLREPYRNMWWVDVISDDGQNNAGGDQQSIDFEFGTIQTNSSVAANLWASYFSTIYRANTFINRAPGISLQGNQNILRNQFLGEAYFIRSLCYYNLVQLFGDVPLVINEITNTENLQTPRTPATQVLQQVEADLLEALKTLPIRHPNPNLIQPLVNISGGMEVGRPTAGSAKALLGTLYLLRGEPAKAETVLKEVVNSNVYSLMSNYANNFGGTSGTKNNAESVFEIQYATPAQVPGGSHDFSFQFGPVEDNNYLARNRPTDNTMSESVDLFNTLVQAFPAGDNRRTISVRYNVQSPVRSITAKYYVPGAGNQGSVNWPVFRYSEVLLLLAEALQAQSKDAEALTELNKVRAHPRTGLTALSGLTGNALRDAIRLERRLELNMECKRLFDLRRWGIHITTLQTHGRPLQAGTNGYLPIPQGEIDKNPQFTQNAGY